MTYPMFRTEFQELVGYHSDYHKDVYGFRPRAVFGSIAEVKEAIAHLDKIAPDVWAAEARREAAAVAMAEAEIDRLIALGAGNRAVAIKWLAQAHDAEGDNEYLCYKLGIPYGYFEENANA